MQVRNSSGVDVYYQDKVLLLMNQKHEWVFPKGVIRSGDFPDEIALRRVQQEAGVKAKIVSTAGRTNYEFYSISRQRPVCNRITWYIMEAKEVTYQFKQSLGFRDGGFFPVEEAINLITYSQDKSLMMLSYQKYKELDSSI